MLAERHRRLLERSEGDVLDLDLPDDLATLTAAMVPGAEVTPGYDAVVGVAALVRFGDLAAAVGAAERLLRPGGRLHLVEPTSRSGPAGLALGTVWAWHPAVRGRHVGRDVVDVVRHTSLTVLDTERFTMPTSVRPLRELVALTAERPAALADDHAATAALAGSR